MCNGLLDASHPYTPKSGSSRGSAGAEGAGRWFPSGWGATDPPRPAAAGEGATAPRWRRGAAPLTCRLDRVPMGPSPFSSCPASPAAARLPPCPEQPAAFARRRHGGSARSSAHPLKRALPRRSEESPCPCGWDVEGRDKAGEGEELFFFFLPVSCGRWCSSKGANGMGRTTAKVTLPGCLAFPRAVWRPAKPLVIGFPSFSLSDCGRVRHALLKQPQPPEDEALCC